MPGRINNVLVSNAGCLHGHGNTAAAARQLRALALNEARWRVGGTAAAAGRAGCHRGRRGRFGSVTLSQEGEDMADFRLFLLGRQGGTGRAHSAWSRTGVRRLPEPRLILAQGTCRTGCGDCHSPLGPRSN